MKLETIVEVSRPLPADDMDHPSPPAAPFHSQDTSSYATALFLYSALLHPVQYLWYLSDFRVRHRNIPRSVHECRYRSRKCLYAGGPMEQREESPNLFELSRVATEEDGVNRHHGSRLQSIQHPLRLVVSTIAKIHIAPQTLRSFRLLRQIIQYRLCNNHSLNY